MVRAACTFERPLSRKTEILQSKIEACPTVLELLP